MASVRNPHPQCIEPGTWPQRTGTARVLVEDPDPAELWATADLLREAGYDVATCVGPTHAPAPRPRHRRMPFARARDAAATVCPLLEGRRCPLADGADAIVSPTYLEDGRAIHAALSAKRRPQLVLEGTRRELAETPAEIVPAGRVTLPVTPQRLLAEVERVLRQQ